MAQNTNSGANTPRKGTSSLHLKRSDHSDTLSVTLLFRRGWFSLMVDYKR